MPAWYSILAFALALVWVSLPLSSEGNGAAEQRKRAAQHAQACDAGDATACGSLGLMYDSGEGVPKDRARAAELHRRSEFLTLQPRR